jgi:DNA-binding response OmpR family regulator
MRRVLLADQDGTARETYAHHLKVAAFEVEGAADGRDALAKAMVKPPDALVAAPVLAGIDGYELTWLIRHDPLTANTSIIMLGGETDTSQAPRAYAAGVNTFLVKPCQPSVLLAEVRRLLQQSRDLRIRSGRRRSNADEQLSKAATRRHEAAAHPPPALSKAFRRFDTRTPPTDPPELICPTCDAILTYERSHIGGVNQHHSEQWDYYECPFGCGTFQYRARTRKLRRVV